MLKFTVLTVCLLVPWSAHAQQTTGDPFTVCEDYERGARQNVGSVSLPNINAGVCHGYFQAVGHLASFYRMEPGGQSVKALRLMCLPSKGLSVAQLIRMFMAYARAHPEEHHQSAVFGVVNAINPAFPCND
jgi:hypothetical protein